MGHVLDFPPAKIYSAAREEWRMRGEVERQRSMLSVVDAERCVPEDHPIRRIKTLADAELTRLSRTFDAIYAEGGRPSIPPERLLKALLLIALYSVRSERQLCEQLHYNLLFRFFLGLGMHEPIFDASTFAKNKARISLSPARVLPRRQGKVVSPVLGTRGRALAGLSPGALHSARQIQGPKLLSKSGRTARQQ